MIHTLLSKIVTLITAPVFLIGSLLTPATVQTPQANLGASLPQAVGIFETSLASPISASATSFTLSQNAIRGGGTLSGYNCFTIDEGTSQAEIACGTVSSTAVTSVTRGISYEDGITSVAGNKFAHRRGANVKITDYPVLQILKAQNNGEYTFPNILKYDTSPTFSTSTQIVSKGYVDGVAISGGVDASTSAKGISKLSYAPASSTNPIAVGDNDPRVPTTDENDALVGNNTDIAVGTGNKFVTQTGLIHNAETFAVDSSGSSTAYTATLSPAPTSLTNGMTVRVKIGLANTTTTPTLNINGSGAKTIVKYVNTALVAGDISAGMYCTFVYDSTNTVWVLQNPIATTNATLSGYEIVTGTDTVNFNSVKIANITINAPSGKKIVGGGWRVTATGNQSGFVGMDNGPTDTTGASWNVQVRASSGTTDATVTAYAICLPVTT